MTGVDRSGVAEFARIQRGPQFDLSSTDNIH